MEFVGKRRTRFCSKSCAARAAGDARAARIRAELAAAGRRCAYTECRELLVQREGERVTSFRERSHCGPECVSKARRAGQVVLHCRAPGCGQELVQREGEAWSDFVRRSSCDASCRTALGHLKRDGLSGAAAIRTAAMVARGGPTRPKSKRKAAPATPAKVLPTFAGPARTERWRPASWGGSIPIEQEAS